MKNKSVEIGDILNGRTVIGKNGYKLKMKCNKCGIISICCTTHARTRFCRCYSPKSIRASGLVYTNSQETINKLKEKYKNGITKQILEEFSNSIL